jgi:hypothetical protein
LQTNRAAILPFCCTVLKLYEMKHLKVFIGAHFDTHDIEGTTAKFNAAADTIADIRDDIEVINPANFITPELNTSDAIELCRAQLLNCQAVVFLPDWIDCPIGRVLHELATAFSIVELTFDELDELVWLTY